VIGSVRTIARSVIRLDGAQSCKSTLPTLGAIAAFSVWTIAVALAYFGDSTAAQCAVQEVSHPFLGQTCPATGRIGNVSIAVPQEYLLGPFTYVGVDIWNSESYSKRPRNPTLMTPIANFAIRIGYPGFHPVNSRADREDYRNNAFSMTRAGHRWIHAGFESYDVASKGTKREQLRRWLSDKGAGPFDMDAHLAWGLQHYQSSPVQTTVLPREEIFYDPRTEDTFIYCKTQLKATPEREPFTTCVHSFLIRQWKVRVSIDNIQSRDDLEHWKEVEDGLKKVFESFVVWR
jgi:hypothetical protein